MNKALDIEVKPPSTNVDGWVRETWFGRRFLNSHTWLRYVLSVALADFQAAMARAGISVPENPLVLDAGCGHGLSIPLLEKAFAPSAIVAIDLDHELVANATRNASACRCATRVLHGSVIDSGFADNSIDIAFCHQLLHHTAKQTQLLQEMRRIIKPSGILLSAESCKSFIHSYLVRYLFAHPMHAQQSATEYLQLIRDAGFEVPEAAIQISTPWWSKPDLGLKEKWGLTPIKMEPTEILLAAINQK